MTKFSSSLKELFQAHGDGTIDKYYKTLGIFVTFYSAIEADLQTAIARLVGLESPTAQAVFNGVRTDAAISYINRIADAQNWPKERRDEFAEFSGRIGSINKLRNDILHFGARWAGSNTWTVSNKNFIHSDDRLREFPISIGILENAISDIEKIQTHLELFIWTDLHPDNLNQISRKAYERPWLYIPPPQVGSRQKNPKTPRKRRRQPRSSPA